MPGLVVVAGGKYTTYRVMAKDAVDEAVRTLDSRVPESVTEDVPLVGADGFDAMYNRRHELAAASGLHVSRIEHLLGRFGSQHRRAARPDRRRPVAGRPVARRG